MCIIITNAFTFCLANRREPIESLLSRPKYNVDEMLSEDLNTARKRADLALLSGAADDSYYDSRGARIPKSSLAGSLDEDFDEEVKNRSTSIEYIAVLMPANNVFCDLGAIVVEPYQGQQTVDVFRIQQQGTRNRGHHQQGEASCSSRSGRKTDGVGR